MSSQEAVQYQKEGKETGVFLNQPILLEVLAQNLSGIEHLELPETQVRLKRLHETASLAPGLLYQFILRKDGSMAMPYANDAIYRLFRVTAEEVRETATKIFSAIHPDDHEDLLASIHTSAREMTPWKKEFRVRFDDGSVFKLYARSTPANGPDSSILWHGMILDITNLTNPQAEVVQDEEPRSRAGLTANRLLSMITYELRSPLSLLSSSTDIIDRYGHELSADKLALQYKYILAASKQLSELLDSMLVHCLQDAEQPEIRTTMMDCGAICRDIAQEATARFGVKHEMTIAIADDCGMAMMDEVLFRRVLNNLLANAFRFTPAGGAISFQVSREPKRLLIVITDSGIGIPEEDQQRVFEPFQYASNAKAYHGLGLGLSNVKSALSQMGGTILLSSKVGAGTSVRIEIPFVAKEAIKISNSMYSILIVEDDELLSSNMALILQLEGYKVRSAKDGFAGLAMIRDQRPDLILCDILMPGMDGHVFLETIRKEPEFADIFFIFVTALSDHIHMQRGMRAGADDFLTKPFSNADLLGSVASHLNKLKTIRSQRSMEPVASQDESMILQRISPREREILLMVGHGLTSKEIADRLFISLKTVEVHRSRLMKKLGATNAVGLARWATIAERMC
jgi:DNA-binding NarL/FixJ family response regulator/nitrogen-specific signal transduction histidine kinase